MVTRTRQQVSRRRRAGTPVHEVPGQGMSIAEAVALWVAQLPVLTSQRGLPYSPATRSTYRKNTQQFARWAGERRLREVDVALVEGWLAELRRRGQTAWSVRGRQTTVWAWLEWCAGRGLVGRHPLRGKMTWQRSRETEVRAFTGDEVRRLLDVCEVRDWRGCRNRTMVAVLWRTGLRASELLGLDVRDYERRARTLHVRHGKGNHARLVGVTDDAAAALEDWLMVWRGEAPGPLFPVAARSGVALGYSGLAQVMRALGKAAEVEGVHAHRLRHTFACDFLRADGDQFTLMSLLGHTTLEMSAKYVRGVQREQAAAKHVRLFRRA